MTAGALLQMRFTAADLPKLRLRVGAAAPGGGLWLARQLTDAIEIGGGAGHHDGGAVVTLMVQCRSNAS